MYEPGIATLIVDLFRQDPFRALGLMGFACVAISATADFDLLRLLGLVGADEEQDRESPVA